MTRPVVLVASAKVGVAASELGPRAELERDSELGRVVLEATRQVTWARGDFRARKTFGQGVGLVWAGRRTGLGKRLSGSYKGCRLRMAREDDHCPWTGLVEVEPKPGTNSLDGAAGAYVNVVALATGRAGYIALVGEWLDTYELVAVGFEDVGPLKLDEADQRTHPHLYALVGRLSDAFPVQFDEFQTWDSE